MQYAGEFYESLADLSNANFALSRTHVSPFSLFIAQHFFILVKRSQPVVGEAKMKIEKIVNTIVRNYCDTNRRNRTLFLLGPSGVGKSDCVRQAAQQLGETYGTSFPVLDLRLSQMEPPDFSGVPSVKDGRTVKNPPTWLPTDLQSQGFILLDEITSAPPVMQAAAYQVALDRCMGDTPIPDGWMVIAAGNRASDRGVNYPLAAPLLARMTVINVESSLDGFVDYCAKRNVRSEVVAFVKSRAEYLNERDETVNARIGDLPIGKPFATQRAWTTAAQYYLDEPAAERLELLRGSVGDRAATDLEAFLRIWQSMPSIDLIFTDPDSVPVPRNTATRYAVSVGVGSRCTKKNFGMAKRYLDRLPGEFKALAVKFAYKRDNTIAESKAFSSFVAENPELWKQET